MIDSVADFDRLIGQSRFACSIYLGYTLAVVLLGVGVALTGILLSADPGSAELLQGLGGTFIAALGTFSAQGIPRKVGAHGRHLLGKGQMAGAEQSARAAHGSNHSAAGAPLARARTKALNRKWLHPISPSKS